MINWLPCCSRQGRMKGKRSRFSPRCTFVGVGTRERGLDQPIAEVQPPLQKGRSLAARTWLLRNHGVMLACSKGYRSRDHCKATAYEDSSPRQAQTSPLLPRLRLGLTSPPTKSSQATAGAWSSESYISKRVAFVQAKTLRILLTNSQYLRSRCPLTTAASPPVLIINKPPATELLINHPDDKTHLILISNQLYFKEQLLVWFVLCCLCHKQMA